jgi:hypothetical protein
MKIWKKPANTFLVWAPAYTHRSSGIRALYRLCHHLNASGYPTAMVANEFVASESDARSGWDTPFYSGPVGDSVMIYPETVSGNPLGAKRVVRWALNDPGLIGGDSRYSDDEIVFAYNPKRLDVVSAAVSAPLGSNRVLRVGLVDPAHIYFDPHTRKTIDCHFTYKGRKLRERFPLQGAETMVCLEENTPDMSALGTLLRQTRRLYSFDHYSNVLREAVICGCEVLVIDENGRWHNPEKCDCSYNINWRENFRRNYATEFHNREFVVGFVKELETRWQIHEPLNFWRRYNSAKHKVTTKHRQLTNFVAAMTGRQSQ